MNGGVRALALVAALGVALVAGDASAQEGNKAGAEALFDEGLALFDRGQLAEACAKFAASQKLEAATGTLMNLARCQEKLGKTASAWATYRDAQALARKEGNPKREAVAKQQEALLVKRLAKLTIVVDRRADGMVVRRDDEVVDPGVWGSAVPIDPGAHVIVATAPHKKDWTIHVDVAETKSSVVSVPALEDAPANEPTPAGAAASPSPATSSSSSAAKPDEGMPAMRIAAIGAGAVGVVALGVGTYFGFSAIGKSNDAKPHCPLPAPCDDEGRALHDDARSAADISTVTLIAGGVLVGAAIVLWIVTPSSRRETVGMIRF